MWKPKLLPLELRFRYLKHLSGHDDYPHQHCRRRDVKPYLESAAVDILQPDVCHAGGISETRRIAVMYDVALAPHCPLGPIALAVCIQVDAVSDNFTI
jgi:L-alanine-DL-glutamate epimerase-like enolase superfamily enzyme